MMIIAIGVGIDGKTDTEQYTKLQFKIKHKISLKKYWWRQINSYSPKFGNNGNGCVVNRAAERNGRNLEPGSGVFRNTSIYLHVHRWSIQQNRSSLNPGCNDSIENFPKFGSVERGAWSVECGAWSVERGYACTLRHRTESGLYDS